MFSVTKFEMQNRFLKVHMKMTNFRCICARRQPQQFCLLVHIHMNFVIFIWIFLDWIWISTFATKYIYRCTMDMHHFKKKNETSRYVFQGGFYDHTEGVVCAEYFPRQHCSKIARILLSFYWNCTILKDFVWGSWSVKPQLIHPNNMQLQAQLILSSLPQWFSHKKYSW